MTSPTYELELRGNDPTGHGYYGAKRGNRSHNGVDIVTVPDEIIVAPFSGVITKIGQVYVDPAKFKYIEITSDIYRTRIMYAKGKNIKVGQRIMEGAHIGTAQDIAGHWGGGMTNHVHMEVWKYKLRTDPEPLIT